MAAVLEITLNSDRQDGIITSAVWDHIPRIGETMSVRIDGPYVDYKVLDVRHWCDAERSEPVPHVSIYVEAME